MPRVMLQRRAFIDNALCERGSIIDIGDHVALASYMTPVAAPPAPPKPDNTVTVHVHRASGEIDIDVNGVEMRIEHAALKVEQD